MDRPKVLVIDDEVSIAEFLRDLLEENGFDVILTYTGREGIAAATQHFPDVILLDVDLPDSDGYSICRQLRQTNFLNTRPILMLTAMTDQKNELTGLNAGADDYLTKPINTTRLLARVKAAIQRNVRELNANPLTLLPGNASIFQDIQSRIDQNSAYAVIYADLNYFKSYNDFYGFIRGDQVIRFAAQCLTAAVEAYADKEFGFVGHVGGDDFIVVTHPDVAEKICQEVIKKFDSGVIDLYDDADRKRGYIEGKTRQGQSVHFPFVGISLVIVDSEKHTFQHPGEISTLASELKTWAKSFGKSAYVTDRRTSTDHSDKGGT